MDNPDPALAVAPGNPDPAAPPVPPAPAAATAFNWKAHLPPDFVGSPTLQKFPDTKEGLTDAVKSHLLLEKLLGYEKVPIPKSKDDTTAWAVFSKALGIPEKPDGYALPDVEIPETMKGLTFDKKKFAEIVHANKLTPDAAKGVWQAYTDMTKQAYSSAVKASQDKITGHINQLKGEWGEAYQSKIELGQMVINKFSSDQETNDFITATLSADPRGIKFLAQIGDQFAENKIGEFKYQRHALTPEEAQREVDAIKSDMSHPYNNPKAPEAEHNRAVDYVNQLIGVARRSRG
jgi:hypothetical protein